MNFLNNNGVRAELCAEDLAEILGSYKKDNHLYQQVIGARPLAEEYKRFLKYDSFRPPQAMMLLAGLIPEIPVNERYSSSHPNPKPVLKLLSDDYIRVTDKYGPPGAPHEQSKRIELLGLSRADGFSAINANISQPHLSGSPKVEEWNKAKKGLVTLAHQEIQDRMNLAIYYSDVWISGDPPRRISLQHLARWADAKGFDIEWLYPEIEHLIVSESIEEKSGNFPVQEKRELVLKGWLRGKNIEIGGVVPEMTRADVWDELKVADSKLFNTDAKKKGGILGATPDKFFKEQNLCRFR